jgi:hypothetical protein
MAPSAMTPSATPNDEDCGSTMSKILGQFRSKKTFGQVMKIYNKKKTGDDVEDEGTSTFISREVVCRAALVGSTAEFLLKECWSKRTLGLKVVGLVKLLAL